MSTATEIPEPAAISNVANDELRERMDSFASHLMFQARAIRVVEKHLMWDKLTAGDRESLEFLLQVTHV